MFTHWNDCVVTWFSIIKCTIYSMSPYLQSFVWIRAALVVIKSDDLVYILVQQKYVTLPHFNFVAILCGCSCSINVQHWNPPCGVIKCVTAVFWQRLRVSICHDWTVELATMQYSPWVTKISTHFFLPTPDTMTNALFMTCVGCISTKKCVLFAIIWYLGMAHDFCMFFKSFHTYIGLVTISTWPAFTILS